MVTLLAKWFIKEKPDPENLDNRQAYGMLTSLVGIFLNLLLVCGKLIIGWISGSIAITADGLNNLSDAGSSIVTLISFRMSRQKPDEEHPFGHGRMEYIAGLLVAVIVLFVGYELLRSSINAIANPAPILFSFPVALVLALSIGVKLYMVYYNRKLGKALDSKPMLNTALDSFSDVVATSVVLLSMIVAHFTGWAIDGWCGLLVSVFILYAGFSALKDTVSLLLGEPPKKAFIDDIKSLVMAHPEIIGVHDVLVHDYGPGRRIITLHVEVPASGDFLSLHDTIDNIERELKDKLRCNALIHMDPIDTDDALTDETRRRVMEVVKGLDERATIHDFRMVSGPTHTNLIFDVCVPYDVKASESQIKQRIAHMVHALDSRYFAIVTVDREIEGRT